MRRRVAVTAALLAGCALGPDLPEVPAREELRLDTSVDPPYEDVLANPEDPAANGRLGIVLHRLGRPAQAELFYRRAHLLEVESIRWLYYMAKAQESQGNYGSAMASLHVALSKDREYLPAEIKLAELLLRTKSIPESEQLFRELTRDERASALAFYRLGKIQAGRGRPETAIESYLKACEQFPAYGPAHYALGVAYAQVGRDAESREHFLLAGKHRLSEPVVDDPLLAEILGEEFRPVELLRKSERLEAGGDVNEAAEACEKALAMDPLRVEAHARLIWLRTQLGQPDQAEKHFRDAVELDPDHAENYLFYGLLMLSQKRFQDARDNFGRALSINPCFAEALTELGYLLEQDQQLQEAESHYREAIANKPEYRQAHLRLGGLLMRRGHSGEAAREFGATLKVEDGKTPRHLFEIARYYMLAGHRSTATGYIRKARAMAATMEQTTLLDLIDSARWPLM